MYIIFTRTVQPPQKSIWVKHYVSPHLTRVGTVILMYGNTIIVVFVIVIFSTYVFYCSMWLYFSQGISQVLELYLIDVDLLSPMTSQLNGCPHFCGFLLLSLFYYYFFTQVNCNL